jgi:hypothetical protein
MVGTDVYLYHIDVSILCYYTILYYCTILMCIYIILRGAEAQYDGSVLLKDTRASLPHCLLYVLCALNEME